MTATAPAYTGRFAPSPSGPLHAGSLVAALASWLDARAWNQGHGGRWLVRIEDLDTQRCVPGATDLILHQLQACSLLPDAPTVLQSQRLALYEAALDRLLRAGRAYPCGCSRKAVQAELVRRGMARPPHADLAYPGTCRPGLGGKAPLAVRFRLAHGAAPTRWTDRRLGAQQQDVAADVGDFVLKRADGPFSYQLGVVVDDHAQDITHIVRGEDLADNTARQILLQQALGLPTPRYLHTPLVLAADGQKLSKQTGATALGTSDPLQALNTAAGTLGLAAHTGRVTDALSAWVQAWRALYNPAL